MKKSLFVALCGVLLLSGCDEAKLTIPEGFDHMGKVKATHFVYLDLEKVRLREKARLRSGGKTICTLHKNQDYCEVYMWTDRKLVSKGIPVENRKEVAVIYTWKNDKVSLKMIK
jgi:hypothetical protein